MARKKLFGLELIQVATMTFTTLVLLGGCVSQSKYDALEARYRQLNEKLSSQINANQMQIVRLQDSIRVRVNDELLFPSGGGQMPLKAQQAIAPLVVTLASMQQTKIAVNGYTDNRPIGAELIRQGITSNLVLSQKRADEVMHFMILHSINPSMVSARGFGDADPVASNDTEAGRAQNRRVELMLAGSGGELSPSSLPATTVVVSSPLASPLSKSPDSRAVADPKPSIVWHQVNGHWRWHCLTNCSKYRRYHANTGEE